MLRRRATGLVTDQGLLALTWGDPPHHNQILLTRDGCHYVVMLPVGTSLEDAIRYARGL